MRKFVSIALRKPREAKIERPVAKRASLFGWFVEKIEKTAGNGFPDRFFARCSDADRCPHCGRGRIVLMEFKRDGKEPEPLQAQRIEELRKHGVEVYVVDSQKAANKILGIK